MKTYKWNDISLISFFHLLLPMNITASSSTHAETTTAITVAVPAESTAGLDRVVTLKIYNRNPYNNNSSCPSRVNRRAGQGIVTPTPAKNMQQQLFTTMSACIAGLVEPTAGLYRV